VIHKARPRYLMRWPVLIILTGRQEDCLQRLNRATISYGIFFCFLLKMVLRGHYLMCCMTVSLNPRFFGSTVIKGLKNLKVSCPEIIPTSLTFFRVTARWEANCLPLNFSYIKGNAHPCPNADHIVNHDICAFNIPCSLGSGLKISIFITEHYYLI